MKLKHALKLTLGRPKSKISGNNEFIVEKGSFRQIDNFFPHEFTLDVSMCKYLKNLNEMFLEFLFDIIKYLMSPSSDSCSNQIFGGCTQWFVVIQQTLTGNPMEESS